MSRSIRTLRARWEIRFTLQTVTALRTGNGDASTSVDADVAVDDTDDGPSRPVLFGSGLAGALRDHLCATAFGHGVDERDAPAPAVQRVERLFGAGRADPTRVRQGAIMVEDSVAERHLWTFRDHVRIHSTTGTVAEVADAVERRGGLKFDRGEWAPGLRFPVRVAVEVETDPKRSTAEQDEADLIIDLMLGLHGIDSGDIRLGATVSRGFGRCVVTDLRVRRFDLTERSGWVQFAADAHDDSCAGYAATFDAAWRWKDGQDSALQDAAAERRSHSAAACMTVEAPVVFRDGILLGETNPSPDGPDRTAARSGKALVITGTALVGAGLRRAARTHVATLAGSDPGRADRAQLLLDELFGAQQPLDGTSVPPFGGALQVDETPLEGSVEIDVVRIALDPWTGAPIEHALVQERVPFGGRSTLRLSVRPAVDSPAPEALFGLAMLAIRDVALGLVPLGGTSAIGRGYAEPDGDLTVKLASGTQASSWEGTVPLSPHADGSEPLVAVENWVTALHTFIEGTPS